MIELTEQQQQALRQGQAVQVRLPELGSEVVVLRADLYEEIREMLELEQERKAIAETALKAARRWAQENPY